MGAGRGARGAHDVGFEVSLPSSEQSGLVISICGGSLAKHSGDLHGESSTQVWPLDLCEPLQCLSLRGKGERGELAGRAESGRGESAITEQLANLRSSSSWREGGLRPG